MKSKIIIKVLISVIIIASLAGLFLYFQNQAYKLETLSRQIITNNAQLTSMNSEIAGLNAKLQVSTDLLNSYQQEQNQKISQTSLQVQSQSNKIDTAYQSVAKYLQLNHTLCQADYSHCGKGILKGFVIMRDGKQFCHVPTDQSIVAAFNASDEVLVEKFKGAWSGSQFELGSSYENCPTSVTIVGYSN
jgi:hypothetical protein